MTPRTVACQLRCPWGFSRQENWRRLPFPSPGEPPNPGIGPRSSALQADSLLSEPPGGPYSISQPWSESFMFNKKELWYWFYHEWSFSSIDSRMTAHSICVILRADILRGFISDKSSHVAKMPCACVNTPLLPAYKATSRFLTNPEVWTFIPGNYPVPT